eukprot:2713372-Pyramimonas_sp.AAC.1
MELGECPPQAPAGDWPQWRDLVPHVMPDMEILARKDQAPGGEGGHDVVTTAPGCPCADPSDAAVQTQRPDGAHDAVIRARWVAPATAGPGGPVEHSRQDGGGPCDDAATSSSTHVSPGMAEAAVDTVQGIYDETRCRTCAGIRRGPLRT